MRITDEQALRRCRSRQRCECCGRRGFVHAAHYIATGMGGGRRLDVDENLVALSPVCHASHHNGHYPTPADLLYIIATRHGVSTNAIQAYLWYLLRAPKGSAVPRLREYIADPENQYDLLPLGQDQRRSGRRNKRVATPETGFHCDL